MRTQEIAGKHSRDSLRRRSVVANLSRRRTMAAAARNLAGKTAIVTGSTSGIGLGIANALAAAGARIVLNGFGDPAHIASRQKQLATAHSVQVSYSPADMQKKEDIVAMVEQVRAACRSAVSTRPSCSKYSILRPAFPRRPAD